MHAARTLHSTRAEASCTQYLYRIVQTGPPEVGYDQRILSAAHSAAGRRRATIDTPAVVSRASEVSRDKRRSSLAPVSSGVTASHAYKHCLAFTVCFHCLPELLCYSSLLHNRVPVFNLRVLLFAVPSPSLTVCTFCADRSCAGIQQGAAAAE